MLLSGMLKQCGSYKNRRFGETYGLHHKVVKNQQAKEILAVTSSRIRLRRITTYILVTANIAPSSPILVTLMMGAIHSSERSVLIWATRRNIAEDSILLSHRRAKPQILYIFIYIYLFIYIFYIYNQ
jgi:hypothetical protein